MKDTQKPRSVARAIVLCVATMSLGHAVAEAEISTVPRLQELPSPAPLSSSLSRVSRDDMGNLYLSWVTQDESKATLAYSKIIGDTWSPPQTISEGSDWFVNWADFPLLSMTAEGGVAHWLQTSGEGTYDYDVMASFYDKKQARWSDGIKVNSSGVAAEHGFVSMLPSGQAQTLVAWLDGRNTKSQPDAGPMTLRAALFNSSGSNLREWELDKSTCDCCQTSAAMTDAGPVVVYRDRSKNEIRDIAIVRLLEESWTKPEVIYHDDWQVMGCPVNGPAVAADGHVVAVAWFTAKNGSPKVQLALSVDNGASFASPIQVSGSDTNGRVDVEILASGELVVSWMDTRSSEAVIMLSRFSPSGALMENVEVAASSASRRSGFPVIESVDNTVYLSWTDISAAPRVRVMRVVY